ncbi:MAG TPA: DnaJ C-terminal domain-containing protein [Paenirhodobacter sp.]
MADNKTPYDVLGVAKAASDADIKKAYRRLAKELHPDLTGNDPAKADRFKAVSAAYDLLRDTDKRRRYDAGEIDASGQERPQQQSYRHYAETDRSGRYDAGGGFDDLGDLFKNAFRSRGFGDDFTNRRQRGQDVHFHMQISFREAVEGGKKPVTLPDIGRVEISIPPGIEDGQTLRLAGKGGPGTNGGPAGDALITVSVAADPIFTRDGDDIHMDLPISIDEAVLGGPVEVPLPGGRVRLKVPAQSSSGRVMRLRGKGITRANGRAGDLLVTLRVVLPQTEDAALAAAIRDWRAAHSYDPRADWPADRGGDPT